MIHQVINAYALGAGGGGGAGLPYFSAESLGSQTVSGTTYTTIHTLTIPGTDQAANTDYLVFWMADLSMPNGTNLGYLAPYLDGVQQAETVTQCNQSPSEIHSRGGFFRMQSGASPSNRTIDLKCKTNTTGVNCTLLNARIFAIPLGPDDVYAESLSRSTTSSTSFAAKTGVSFTPPSAGDYLILGSAVIDSGRASDPQAVGLRLSDGTNVTPSVGLRTNQATVFSSAMVGYKLASVSGAITVNLEYCTLAGTNTSGIASARIVALRLDRFSEAHVAALASDTFNATTTYTTGHSQTFTPAAGDHLTIACGLLEANSSSANAPFVELDDGGTIVQEAITCPTSSTNDQGGRPYSMGRIATYANASRTQALKIKNESTSTTRLKRGALIATLRVDDL